jgi:membrane peptidoglycan carboxypeptidase
MDVGAGGPNRWDRFVAAGRRRWARAKSSGRGRWVRAVVAGRSLRAERGYVRLGGTVATGTAWAAAAARTAARAEADRRLANDRADGQRVAAERAAEEARAASEAALREARAAAVQSALQRVARRREEALRQAALQREEAVRLADREREELRRQAAARREEQRRTVNRLLARERARRARRRRLVIACGLVVLLAGVGLTTALYYVDSVPVPAELDLPESTVVYFADGRTPMATLGSENRTILAYADMNDAVKQAIVAAEDRTYWSHDGVNLASVVRAAWNNLSGDAPQGGSTISQQYARIAADLKGFTYSRKTREAVMAWKLDRSYSKEEILGFYLNTVPFGRGAYGIEAAAQAFFGKTANRAAPVGQQVTVAEAMLLASLVKQPEPDPDNPAGSPGYDPARGGVAAANSQDRWEYVRDGMLILGYLTPADAAAIRYPHTVRELPAGGSKSGMDRPTGLVVSHVLSELWHADPFRDVPRDHIRNGGYRIVTTIDARAQDLAEAAADIRRPTAPAAVRGQPANWQAALVAVEPGTGRVLAYYGGSTGTGADHAGWFYDSDDQARGFGQHPPGSSFKVYDLAEALRQRISVRSVWPSPAVKEFPASGRTRGSPNGPVRNASTAKCQPRCALWEATVASLNVTFFDLTERVGTANVIDMARRAGIDSMWANRTGRESARVDLRGLTGPALAEPFSTEVGIGQYGVTVLDHANGMATFAAGGRRAQAHFVREVSHRGQRVYAERLTQSDVGLTAAQIDELNWTLGQVPSARLGNGWDAAGKTGTWQDGASTTRNAHAWMVGYTGALAAAVWLGTSDGRALRTAGGRYDVYGASHAAPIWRQFMVGATAALGLDPAGRAFADPAFGPSPRPIGAPATPGRR